MARDPVTSISTALSTIFSLSPTRFAARFDRILARAVRKGAVAAQECGTV